MNEKISNSIYLGFGTLEIILLVWLQRTVAWDNYAMLWVMPIVLLLIPLVRTSWAYFKEHPLAW